MKKILTLLMAFSVLGAAPIHAETKAETTTQSEIAHDVVVKVDGMVCDFCAQSLKKVFLKEDAVSAIDVDLDNGEVIVDYKDGQTLSHDTITKLIVDAGYTVSGMTHASAKK